MEELTQDAVLALLSERVRAVMALDDAVPPHARFDEDLHADSLDLVEIVEGVERDLRERGVAVKVPDEELVAVETVREAAALIAQHAGA